MENNKIIDRVTRYIYEKGESDYSFSIKAGLSVGQLSNIRKKGTDLSMESVKRILSTFPDINREWLIFGDGDMLLSHKGKDAPNNNTNNNNNTINIGGSNVPHLADAPQLTTSTISADLLTKAILEQQKITMCSQEMNKRTADNCERLISVIERMQSSIEDIQKSLIQLQNNKSDE